MVKQRAAGLVLAVRQGKQLDQNVSAAAVGTIQLLLPAGHASHAVSDLVKIVLHLKHS